MDSELDRRNWWDAQSCAEFEEFLDSLEQEPAEPPCTCYYTDVDLVENRYCEAHNRRHLGEF